MYKAFTMQYTVHLNSIKSSMSESHTLSSNVFIIFEDSYVLIKNKGINYMEKDDSKTFNTNTYFCQ